MKRMLINASQAEELRVAMVQQNRLYDLIVERAGFEQKVGNIYKAKITSIEPSLDAVFVDYGSERHGFLPLKEISREYFLKDSGNYNERPDIRKVLKIGQELMIQVEKEERGNKGAALTTFISMAGSYLVLMPNNPRAGGISRRIEGEDRDQLRESLSKLEIPPEMGLIVRTAGVGKSTEEIQWDLNVLISHWRAVDKAFYDRPAPFLIHQEGDLVIRAIRDYLRSDISELYLDTKETFEKAKNYIEQVRPDFVDKIKLYDEPEALFTRFGIEQQIESAYRRTVHLPSGGSIVIDHTEALVAIDINSAGSTKAENIEQTALNTNLEAAEEISRQLRLRDIGGLIVIDFIDMMQFKHQREVENALLSGLRLDRARVQISKISRFGLLELSRQRLRPSLRETIQHVCPTCNGHGSVRSVESIALSIIRIIEEEAMKPNTSEVQVQASTDTATYILNEKRNFIDKIEKHHKVTVFVIPNPNFQQHNYDIKRLRRMESEAGVQKHKPSYQHLENPEVEFTTSKQMNDKRQIDEPAVKNVLPIRPELDTKTQGNGLIKRLWSSMFGTADDEELDTVVNGNTSNDRTGPRHQHPSRTSRGRRDRNQQRPGFDQQNERRTRSRNGNRSRQQNQNQDQYQAQNQNQGNNQRANQTSQEQDTRRPRQTMHDNTSPEKTETLSDQHSSRRKPSDSSRDQQQGRGSRTRSQDKDQRDTRGKSSDRRRGNQSGPRTRKPFEPGKAPIDAYNDFRDDDGGYTQPSKPRGRHQDQRSLQDKVQHDPSSSRQGQQPISHESQLADHPPIQIYQQEQPPVVKSPVQPIQKIAPKSEPNEQGEPLVVRPKTKEEIIASSTKPQEIKATVVKSDTVDKSSEKSAQANNETTSKKITESDQS